MSRPLILAIALLLFAPLCLADNYALLIGVTQVKAAYPSPVLAGIGNDLALAQKIASRLGVPPDRQQTLVGDSSTTTPSYANVMLALQTLQMRARPGDFVLLYLSGHGVQQPSMDAQETDRLDEVFLLADSQPWEPTLGIANALRDKEIHQWLTAMDAKQVKVWLVADTCHAGNMTRALLPQLDDEVSLYAMKGLRSGWMGIKNWLRKGTTQRTQTRDTTRFQTGGLPHVAAFLAADEAGGAMEVELKKDGRKVGLFTWALQRALENIPLPAHPDELASETLRQYTKYPAWVSRPVFEAGDRSNSP